MNYCIVIYFSCTEYILYCYKEDGQLNKLKISRKVNLKI